MKFLLSLLLFLIFISPSAVLAQDDYQEGDEVSESSEEEVYLNIENANLYNDVVNPDDLIAPMRRRALEVDGVDIPVGDLSLFFTPREMALLEDAKGGFVARIATEDEVARSQDPSQRPRGPREIALGGVLYVADDDWIVWINNQKITPSRIPPEITDIRVGKDYVRIKWYDAYTNQIFPIKLQPQQRFNIDTRIFLPG